MEVPVQFFQSVVGIELAITGALLFQIRFFEPATIASERGSRPAPVFRLLVAVVLGATVFGSLYAIATGGERIEAMAVTLGVALSVLPILLRVLPPLRSSTPDAAVTMSGLGIYAVVVVGLIALLSV